MKKSNLLIFPLLLLALVGCANTNNSTTTLPSENAGSEPASEMASLPEVPNSEAPSLSETPSLPELPAIEAELNVWYQEEDSDGIYYVGNFEDFAKIETTLVNLENPTLGVPDVDSSYLYYVELYLYEGNEFSLFVNPFHEDESNLSEVEYNTYVKSARTSMTDISDYNASQFYEDATAGQTVAQYIGVDYVFISSSSKLVLLSYDADYGMIMYIM